LFKEVVQCTREIEERSKDLQVSMIGFAGGLAGVGKLSEEVDCNNQADVFRWMGDVVKSSSRMITDTGFEVN